MATDDMEQALPNRVNQLPSGKSAKMLNRIAGSNYFLEGYTVKFYETGIFLPFILSKSH